MLKCQPRGYVLLLKHQTLKRALRLGTHLALIRQGAPFAPLTLYLNLLGVSAMKSVQKGFTLIELMIVVAIMGILAAIAIRAYRDYTVRSKITEGLNLVSSAKVRVGDGFKSNDMARLKACSSAR